MCVGLRRPVGPVDELSPLQMQAFPKVGQLRRPVRVVTAERENTYNGAWAARGTRLFGEKALTAEGSHRDPNLGIARHRARNKISYL